MDDTPTDTGEAAVYHCTDEELGRQLHQLFEVDGETEVEIHHPTEGVIVYHRDTWRTQQAALQKVLDMSPTERLEEKSRLKRKFQMQFRTALIDAEVRTIDVTSDENNFGKDIHGKEIDMTNMVFASQEDYPKGTKKIEHEIGAFVDESMRKPPIRIVAQLEAKVLN